MKWNFRKKYRYNLAIQFYHLDSRVLLPRHPDPSFELYKKLKFNAAPSFEGSGFQPHVSDLLYMNPVTLMQRHRKRMLVR